MESFNRGEQVIASFYDVEKAFNSGIMDSGIKFSSSGLPTKITRWLPDFLVARIIQVKVDGFLLSKIYPKTGVPQGSALSPLLFLIYVNNTLDPKHHLNSKSWFADDTVITKLQKLQNPFIRLALRLLSFLAVATGQLRNSSRNPSIS